MKTILVTALLAASATGSAVAAEPLDIAKKANCLACHDVNAKKVGPAWKDVAKKYAGDAGAQARLMTAVKKGGKGNWGAIPMPPNPTIKDDDLKTLVQFILALK